MKLTLEHNGNRFQCDTLRAKSLAITMDFDGPQPNHFGANKAKQTVLKLGSFTGSTEAGGSCNVNTLEVIPHCNGTHTETISHIVNEDIWIGHAAQDAMQIAALVTVTPVTVERLPEQDRSDDYRPQLDAADLVITAKMLQAAIDGQKQFSKTKPTALLIRTLPNTVNKCARAYGGKVQPPFLTVQAMLLINRLGITHLLVDFPSVDRMYDDGLLTNHHLFWHVEEGTHRVNSESRQDKTITEMVYVEDDIVDGIYILDLQIPAFGSDAAPSRPLLFPTKISPVSQAK